MHMHAISFGTHRALWAENSVVLGAVRVGPTQHGSWVYVAAVRLW